MIIKQQLCPESGVQFTNTEFSKTTFVEDTFDDPAESNKGLFAIVSLPPHTVIGIYEGGELLKASTVTSSRYKSDYAVQYQHLIRDGYDRQKGQAETVIESELSKCERFLDVVDVLTVVWNEFLYTDELEVAELVEVHGLHRAKDYLP